MTNTIRWTNAERRVWKPRSKINLLDGLEQMECMLDLLIHEDRWEAFDTFKQLVLDALDVAEFTAKKYRVEAPTNGGA